MHIAPYLSAFGLLTVLHAARVISLRIKHKVSLGTGNIPQLERMIRVFGNHAEYVPIGLILLFALEFIVAPVWYIHLAGMLLLIGRIVHAVGLSRSTGGGKARTAGMLLTFASLLISSVGVLIWSFLGPSI
jgi:uncharacterized membrane protein YecN with MAPEG domain